MPETADDETAAAAVVRGKRECFAELVRRHQGTVYRIARRILNDDGEAADAAQEAFVKAYRNLPSFDTSRAFAPWLYRIARNHALDVSRKRGASPERLEAEEIGEDDGGAGAVGRDVADPEAPSALDSLEAAERGRRVAEALERLDPKYREVVELYHFEELTYAEIAETLGVPIGTVMTRLFRARGRLAELMKGAIAA